MSDDLRAFVDGLPKAELHVHHIGSASPDAVLQLAQRHAGITPVPTDREGLARYFTFTDSGILSRCTCRSPTSSGTRRTSGR